MCKNTKSNRSYVYFGFNVFFNKSLPKQAEILNAAQSIVSRLTNDNLDHTVLISVMGGERIEKAASIGVKIQPREGGKNFRLIGTAGTGKDMVGLYAFAQRCRDNQPIFASE